MTPKQRLSWFAHLFKAITNQDHKHLRPVFAPYIPVDGVVLDVGAHAGQFSKLFSGMVPRGEVLAFEPSAYARSILEPALRFSNARNVKVVAKGLSDCPSKMTLSTPIKRSGSLGFGVATLGQTDREAHAQVVDLITLDSLKLQRVDFIKADIEGWEYHMLRGGHDTIAACKPAIFMEINKTALSRAGSSESQIRDFLGDLGYVSHLVSEEDFLFVSR